MAIRKKKTKAKAAKKQGKSRDRIRKGIFILPNLMTSASLMAGFFSICKTFDGDFVTAAWAILVAGFFDGMDGRIARLTKTTSDFGANYDSLCDLVSFGVAPGLLIYQFALRYAFSPGLGWAAAFLFTACGALRLARFNVQAPSSDGKWFVGLPIPAASSIPVLTVLFFDNVGWVTPQGVASSPNFILLLVLVAALMMVSTVRYWSFKNIDIFRRHAFGTFIAAVIVLAIVFREPQRTLFTVAVIYLFSGPVMRLFIGKGEKAFEPAAEEQ